MTSVEKVFRGRTADSVPPIPFTVELENSVGETKSVSFEAFGTAPADALLLVGRMGRINTLGETVLDASELGGFFEKVLLPESADAWSAFLTDREWRLDGETLVEVWTWLQETWEARPTQRSPGSSATRSPNGTSSTANPSLPGSV